jgi:hypothetical protein
VTGRGFALVAIYPAEDRPRGPRRPTSRRGVAWPGSDACKFGLRALPAQGNVQHLSRRDLVDTADHRALPLGTGDVAAEAALLTSDRGGFRPLCCRSGTSIAHERTHRLAGDHVLMVDHPAFSDQLACTAPRAEPRIARPVDFRRPDHPQDLLVRHVEPVTGPTTVPTQPERSKGNGRPRAPEPFPIAA